LREQDSLAMSGLTINFIRMRPSRWAANLFVVSVSLALLILSAGAAAYLFKANAVVKVETTAR
jgi:hypothetical protein